MAGPVYPEVARGNGHYESFYLRACDPSAARGVWIRYTVHKRPGAEPNASLWFTFWDPEPHAAKVTLDDLSVPDGGWIRAGESTFGPGRAAGSALGASWDLGFSARSRPLRHLPAEWMYRAPVPRTKTESPLPAALFSGTLSVDGRTIDVDGWPGMVGHNWGAEHAERWVWMHGIAFDGDGGADWLDAAFGRVRAGRWTTPWIGNGGLSLGGRVHRLGGLGSVRGTRVREDPARCDFVLPGDGVLVRGTVGAPHARLVAWEYADPGGGEHNTVNCSIAFMRLKVERPGEAARELATGTHAVYELGMRETGHGVPVQPYPDG